MATGRRVRIATAPLLLVLSLSGCAQLSRMDISDGTSSWQIVPSDSETSVVVQQKLPGGLVSIMCEDDGCRTLLVTNMACTPESTFPVLVNTAIEAGITDGQCLSVEDLEDGDGTHGAILLAEANLLLANIVLDDDVALGVPMSDGSIAVFTIVMRGVRELLSTRKPELFQAPPWLNNDGAEPDNTDEDDAARWRRGVQAI